MNSIDFGGQMSQGAKLTNVGMLRFALLYFKIKVLHAFIYYDDITW